MFHIIDSLGKLMVVLKLYVKNITESLTQKWMLFSEAFLWSQKVNNSGMIIMMSLKIIMMATGTINVAAAETIIIMAAGNIIMMATGNTHKKQLYGNIK